MHALYAVDCNAGLGVCGAGWKLSQRTIGPRSFLSRRRTRCVKKLSRWGEAVQSFKLAACDSKVLQDGTSWSWVRHHWHKRCTSTKWL